MIASRRWPRLAERVLEEALAVGAAVGDAAGHGGQEGGVGRAPEPGNATHGRRSLQGDAAVDSLHGIGPAARRRHRPHPRRAAARAPRVVRGDRRARLHRRVVGRGRQRRRLHAARARGGVGTSLRSGVAIAPAFTRGPALLAQTAASMADAAPGRLRARDRGVVARHRRALERDPVRAMPYRALATCCGSSAARSPARRSPSATRPSRCRASGSGSCPRNRHRSWSPRCARGMLRLAGEEGDGAIVNWLSAERRHPDRALRRRQGDRRPHLRRADRTTSPRSARSPARQITSYLTVGAYAEFQEWLGRGPALTPMWDAWAAGDRARALELVPDEVDRRAHRVGHPRADPRRCRALRRQRRHHDRPGDPRGRGDAVPEPRSAPCAPCS